MNASATPQATIVFGPHQIPAAQKQAHFQRYFEGVPVGLPRYAGFPKRIAAKLIDSILMLALNGPVVVATLWLVFSGSPNFDDPVTMTRLNLAYAFLQLLGYALSLSYATYFHGKYGATLGKMVMGIRVVGSDGGPISYKRALGRGLAEILSALTLYIGYFMALFGKERAALHDFICDTRVIEARTPLAPVMRCASCNSALSEKGGLQSCATCQSEHLLEAFPAALQQIEPAQPQQVETDQASCFYHPHLIATQTCAYSGRYLCDLCAVPHQGRFYSGQSLWELRQSGKQPEFLAERRLFDPLVTMVALLPLISFPPLILVSLPATIALAIYAYRKPGRLLGGSKLRLLSAIGMVMLQAIALTVLLFYVLPLYL